MADSLSEALNSTEEVTYTPSERYKFIVDNDLRTISSPTIGQAFGVYHDRNVQVVDWEMPRYYHDIDLAEYTARIHYLAKNTGHIYLVTDMLFTDDTITFTWTVDLPAYLENGGTVTFALCLRKVDNDGYVANEFNTTVYSVSTLRGLQVEIDPGDEPLIRDYIAQIQAMVANFDDSVDEAIDDVNTVASGHISTMQTLVESAAASASNASQSANGASQSATNAAASAQTAKDEADRAFDTTPEGYEVIAQKNKTEDKLYEGNPIEIETLTERDIKKLAVDISPIQDLHGYDHPWPAGGGVNVLDFAQYFTEGETVTQNGITATFSNGYLKVTGTNTSSTFNIIYKYCNDVLPAGTYIMPNNLNIRCNIDGQGNNNYAMAITVESSLQMAAFYVFVDTNATVDYNIPMMLVKGETRPTTYSPYSNICPITGRTEVSATRTGKNLIDTSSLYQIIAERVDIGTKTFDYRTYLKAGTYTLSNNGVGVVYCRKQGATDAEEITIHNQTVQSGTFTITEDGYYAFWIYFWNGIPVSDFTDVMLEKGTEATEYEPYQSKSVTVQLGQTVYGGTLNVTTGELTVDRAFWTRNTANMNNDENYPGWIHAGIAELLGTGLNYGLHNQMLNIGTMFAVNTTEPNDILYLPKNIYYKTQTEWQALAMDVQIVVQLATPQTFTLTPAQLDLLKGYNFVSSNDGTTMSVTVREGAYQLLSEAKDVSDGITSKISTIEDKVDSIETATSTEETDLYLFKSSARENVVGNLMNVQKIVGCTVAWNQLVQNGNFADTTDWINSENVSISASGNVLTATVSGPLRSKYYGIHKSTNFSASTSGHNFFMTADINAPYSGAGIGVTKSTAASNIFTGVANTWSTVCSIFNFETGGHQFQMYVGSQYASYVASDTFKIRNCMVIDLTQMFGSTIADYIYSLEQANAGAGVAWFKKLFPKDYYAYNAGELISVKTSAHVMRDANNNIIGNYPLDPDLELRGIPKLDSNNNLYYDGDEYEPSGTVKRKYGIVDLGTLNWSRAETQNNHWRFAAILNEVVKAVTPADVFNGICEEYNSVSPGDTYSGVTGVSNNNTTNTIFVCDESYTDAATLKSAMSGVYLVYELATPTTETADAYDKQQAFDVTGTEEYVDTRAVPIPVWNDVFFPTSLISRIDALEDEFNEEINSIAGSLAMVETSQATANHEVGDYIAINNQLYKVTVAIASGEAIVVGTNVQSTTIADELKAILAQLSA